MHCYALIKSKRYADTIYIMQCIYTFKIMFYSDIMWVISVLNSLNSLDTHFDTLFP